MRKSLKKALKFVKTGEIVDAIGECDGIPRREEDFLAIAKDLEHWVNKIDDIDFSQLLGKIFYYNGVHAPPFEDFTFGETVADRYNYQDFCDHNGGWEIELVLLGKSESCFQVLQYIDLILEIFENWLDGPR